jgi:hypothetical protein
MKLFHFDIHIGKHRVLVQSRDIFNNSITGENIAPGAVTAEKIAPKSVGHEQLAPEAVEDLTRLEGELQELINNASHATNAANDAAELANEKAQELDSMDATLEGMVVTITNRHGESRQLNMTDAMEAWLDAAVAEITPQMIRGWFYDEETE